jgi:hypothetical protein
MTQRIQLGRLTVEAVGDWLDVTADLPEGSPFSLARPDGVGILQFSMAHYEKGTYPDIALPALREMIIEFGETQGLGEAARFHARDSQPLAVAGDFQAAAELIRVWFVSNDKDVAMVTYVVLDLSPESPVVRAELEDADAIIASIDFVPTPN